MIPRYLLIPAFLAGGIATAATLLLYLKTYLPAVLTAMDWWGGA